LSPISPTHADVAGMDDYDLKSDYDFKKAVKEMIHKTLGLFNDYLNLK
jgi:hypothetical protein